MKLSDIREAKLTKNLLKVIYRRPFNRARIHKATQAALVTGDERALASGDRSGSIGFPTNPRHRRFFGIREG